MRRALLVLLALPASALAQIEGTSGTIVLPTGVDTINIAQCSGVASTDPPLSDSATVDLTWTVNTFTTTFASGGVFRVWASNEAPITDPSAGTPCTEPKNPSSSTFKKGQLTTTGNVVDIATDNTATMSAAKTFRWRDIVAAAGYGSCDAPSWTGRTVHLCVQWVPSTSSGKVNGSAVNSTLTLDLLRPTGAPTDVSTTPGDGVLHLRCSGNSDIGTFKAKATFGTEPPHYSNQASSCSDLTITGLTNNQTYSVVVYGMDKANNPSAASTPPVDGKPIPTSDFWDRYKDLHGQDSGGCSTTAGAAGILGALSLLVLRRRKP